jgi:hypothetical protein
MEGIAGCFWIHVVDGGHWGRFCGFICFYLSCDPLGLLLLDTVLELTFILKAYIKWLCCSVFCGHAFRELKFYSMVGTFQEERSHCEVALTNWHWNSTFALA